MRPTVVVMENDKFDPWIAVGVLEDIADVDVIDPNSVEEMLAAAADADALIPWGMPLDEAVLEQLERCSVIGICGTGVARIDLTAADANGITVVNAATYAVEEVATHAMALLLSCVRSLPAFDTAVRAGEWGRSPGEPIHRLEGRTLGLVGFGDIARRTAELAQAFGSTVIAYDPYVEAEIFEEYDVTSVGFDELLTSSELLSVHAPITAETHRMLDADAFDRMGQGTIVVNTGRGPVIEEAALLEALDEGTVEMAGLDVFEAEPLGPSPLCDRDDVILSPHIAWYSEESREDAIRQVATDIRRILTGDEPERVVDSSMPWV